MKVILIVALIFVVIAVATLLVLRYAADHTESIAHNKKDQEQVEALASRSGPPISEDTFILTEAVPEFRVELLNSFSPEEVQSGTITITEKTWSTGGKDRLTIWYHNEDGELSYIQHRFWDTDMVF